MLDPQDRLLLLDTLRPPEGYELSFAIGTTYTLDLLALLTAPLGFTIFELAGPPGAELVSSDAVRLLSVLRRYAERISIFCQAGRIAVPPKHAILFGELERSVIEVRPPKGKSFHPKLWVLRYTRESEPVRYRVLCMSRNLTFDRSWDTMLALDGVLKDRKLGFTVNRPLADFVAALPAMAKTKVSTNTAKSVGIAADELRRVEFELPEPFEECAFWPFGVAGYGRSPFEDASRTLVVSPFLAGGTLEQLADLGGESTLISRADALDLIPRSVLSQYDKVYAFNPDITTEQPQNDESAPPDPMGSTGLHAKLYVLETGRYARILTGSANATGAAFHGNVEFLTELVGPKSKCGIDVLLATEKGKVGLRDVLAEYSLDTPAAQLDEALEAQLKRLDEARELLGAAEWVAEIHALDGGAFRVTLGADGLAELSSDLRITARPVLLAPASARPLDGDDRREATFENVSFEGLSAFFALDVQLSGNELVEPCRFVVNARLVGEPEGRRERITQYLLRDREHVIRFLLHLLAIDADDFGGSLEVGNVAADGAGEGRAANENAALLEPLLRALDRTPERLDDVATILTDLKKTEEGRAKLPPGIETIWDAIWQVRESMRSGAKP